MAVSPNLPKKLPKQTRSQVTVEALIQATARILGHEGRVRLSTNRIAEVAGVSVGSLYQYFPNKDALLAELRSRHDRRFLREMTRELGSVGQLPLREAVPRFVRFMVALHAEDPKLHNELAAEIPDSQQETLLAFALTYLEAHREEVRREDLGLAAEVALEAGEALIHRTALREPERLRDDRFVEEVCDLLLRYLAR